MPIAPLSRLGLPARLALALTAIILPLAALIVLEAYQAFGRTPQLVRSRQWVTHTFEVMAAAEQLRSAVKDGERGQRGYLITGGSAYLEVYRTGIAQAPLRLQTLTALTVDNPQQQRRMRDLEELLAARLQQMQAVIDAYQGEGFAVARNMLQSDRGRQQMQALESAIDAVVATERLLLSTRLETLSQEERSVGIAAFIGGLVAIATLILGVLLAVFAYRQAYALELEKRETERRLSAQLLQAQQTMAQTQKMEALGQLTGGVAHDFNNFLQVIRSALAVVQRRLGTADAELNRYLDMATRNTERAAAVTSRLLAFSRQQPLEPKPTDLNRLLSSMAELLRYTLGEGIGLEVVQGAGLWLVAVDNNQLETAVLNLALNARDAMPAGGKLTIETSNTHLDEAYAQMNAEVRAGQYSMVAVSDSGIGMAPEVAARAFEPFFTTKDADRGTGLGLSQVFGFIKQSGGHVKIYSELQQGTTVKMYLPRLVGAEGEEPRPPSRVLPAARAAGETILLVEDNEDVRAFTAQVLAELGYQVAVAADGRSALRLVEQLPHLHLLFTDVGLPGGMSGRQLADEVQRRRPDIKVLYTTGYARNSIIHQGRLDPGVELITKPFTQTSLAAKLRKILEAPAIPAVAAGGSGG